MKHRISYRRHLTGAMTAAALIVAAPMAVAQQTPEQQAKFRAGIDEAVKALDNAPQTKKMSPQAKRELVEFVLGNTLFVMAHEMGHALMYEMNMPVLGREEDAADDLAVLLLIPAKGGAQFVSDSASFWAALSDRQRVPQLSDYADVHSFDLQRAFSMLCLLAGSAPENFQLVQNMNVLPASRLAGCRAEFKQKADSYEDVLDPHVSAPLNLGG